MGGGEKKEMVLGREQYVQRQEVRAKMRVAVVGREAGDMSKDQAMKVFESLLERLLERLLEGPHETGSPFKSYSTVFRTLLSNPCSLSYYKLASPLD